jgi:hypothetical protein
LIIFLARKGTVGRLGPAIHIIDEFEGEMVANRVHYLNARMLVCHRCEIRLYGKALLLDYTDAQIYEKLAVSKIHNFTENTITDPKLFTRRLERERRQGWTLNDEESEIGIRTIGAPVRDHSGAIVAAVSVSAPTFRLSKAEVPMLAAEIKELAGEISNYRR